MIFIVDELLGESRYESGFPSFADAAEDAGHKVYRVKYKPIAQMIEGDMPDLGIYEPVIAYGTIQFCKVFERLFGKHYRPGLFYNPAVKSFEKFAVHYNELGWLLNDDYYILPFGEVESRRKGGIPFFIKPLSGLKDFVGQVITADQFADLSPFHPIPPETLCVISAAKDIQAEFRYVIVEGRVITGSEYRWDNVLDVRIDTHPACDALANLVATYHWQPDSVYICDIALTGDSSAHIIELNAFSSSGLYACDTNKIVAAVAKAAAREFSGEVFDTA